MSNSNVNITHITPNAINLNNCCLTLSTNLDILGYSYVDNITNIDNHEALVRLILQSQSSYHSNNNFNMLLCNYNSNKIYNEIQDYIHILDEYNIKVCIFPEYSYEVNEEEEGSGVIRDNYKDNHIRVIRPKSLRCCNSYIFMDVMDINNTTNDDNTFNNISNNNATTSELSSEVIWSIESVQEYVI